MARIITRDEVRRLMDEEDAQLVDVLARVEYDEEHIPGAVNLPLKELNATTTQGLDRKRPVITYCHDSL
jgi:rhodanese-related sulfurtransferase